MRILLILLISIKSIFALSDYELYKEAFGFVPDEEYQVQLYINDIKIDKKLKVVSIQLTDNYIYNLEILNEYLKEEITINKKTHENEIPFEYELNFDKESLNIKIEDKKLKPWKISIHNKKIKPDTFTNSWYYNIPLNYSYQNNIVNYVYGFNLFWNDFYLEKGMKTLKVSYKNFSIGDLSTSKFGGLTNKDIINGFSYRTDYKNKYNNTNDFSNVELKNKSIVKFIKDSRVETKKILEKGFYDFSDLNNQHKYIIEIIDLTTSEKSEIKPTINFEPNINYDFSFNKNMFSTGIRNSFIKNNIYFHTGIGFTYSDPFKEIGTSLNINDFKSNISYSESNIKNIKQNSLEAALSYKKVKLSYSEKEQEIYNDFTEDFYTRKGKYISLGYNNGKVRANIEKNIQTKKYGYSISYNDSYKSFNYGLKYKYKNNQDFIGFKIKFPLWKKKNTKITLSNNFDYSNNKINKNLSLYGVFDNDYNIDNTIKLTKEGNKSEYWNIDLKKKNPYFNHMVSYNTKKKWSGYINTNIIGNFSNIGLSKRQPLLNESVWFIDKSDIVNEVLIINKNKEFKLDIKKLDFTEEYENIEFKLEHKKNMSGVVKLRKLENIEFEPNFKVKEEEYFLYYLENSDSLKKASIVGEDKLLYLEDVIPGTYIIEFKDRKEKVIIN